MLLALCLALGANRADAQARDSSVDIVLGSGSYTFVLADFSGFASGSLSFVSYPERGTLTRGNGQDLAAHVSSATRDAHVAFFFPSDFEKPLGNHSRSRYAPPADAISVTPGYTSFIFNIRDGRTSSTATMTINLAGADTQMAASGAPTIAATDTGRIRASITGVTDPNGIDVGTLSWQWQQADAPVSGVPKTGDYIDIKDATSSSLFAPTAAQLSRYVRTCVSFKDQFSMSESEGPLCSDGILVDNLSLRLRLRLFLEGPLR